MAGERAVTERTRLGAGAQADDVATRPAPEIAGRILVTRDRFALDAELTLARGERLAVIGANGSGKSTLLAALVGLAPLDATSTLMFAGRPWQGSAVERRGIGFIAQDGLLFPHLTVLDNVAFGPRALGQTRAEARDTARGMLDEVHAAHLASARAGSLSGGERQRVAIARALATDPSTLLLDEPFAALDVDASVEVREIVAEQVGKRDLSLLLVTHDLVDAVRLADRVVVLEGGRIVESIPITDLQCGPASAFAASFAGFARVLGTVVEGGLLTESGTAIPLARLEVEAGIVDGASGLLLAAPDQVEITPIGNAAAHAFSDTVESLIGDGATVLARLRSGLLARVEPDTVPDSGATVAVRILRGRVRSR